MASGTIYSMRTTTYGLSLIGYSLVAWIASFVLVLERLSLFQNPEHKASCDFGLFISCTSVMQTPQASLLGFPNPILGIVGFAITGALGYAITVRAKIASGMDEQVPRPILFPLVFGSVLAFALVVFFWHTSVFQLGVLCPWCMVVWAMVIPFTFHTAGFALHEYGCINGRSRMISIAHWWWVGTVIIAGIIIATIFIQFQDRLI